MGESLPLNSWAGLPYYRRRFVKRVTSLHQIRFNDSTFPHFPHNLAPDFGQYTGERLEMISHDEESNRPKPITTKEKTKI